MTTTATTSLALNGGRPIRSTAWPPWPGRPDGATAAVAEVLRTDRWTVSGPHDGTPTMERRFAEAFARWNGVRYCVSADHGTSALTMALEALGVGAGDEVVVPVLTWVASATAVLRVNAVPIFVDIDPDTGCLSPEAVEAAITPRTAAIVAVHLNYLMADLDRLGAISRAHGIALVEDSAQSHGGIWNGRRAGTIGDIGAFSMQQSKVLTAGEGGAVVTDDENTYRLLQQLRADSAMYTDAPLPGRPCLHPAGDVMGTNYCLSELQAAILLDRLPTLDGELDVRDANARYLNRQIESVPALRALRIPPQQQRVSVFRYAVARRPDAFAGRPTEVVCAAVTAELGLPVSPAEGPLDGSIRFRPRTKAAWRDVVVPRYPDGFPAAHRLAADLMVIHHPALLADRAAMDDILAAFARVDAAADDLPHELGDRR